MATWEVSGAELDTGRECKRSLVAASEDEARQQAAVLRIVVAEVRKTDDYPLLSRPSKPVEHATAEAVRGLSRFVNAALWTTVVLGTIGFAFEAFNVIGGLYTWTRSTPMTAGRGFPTNAPSELVAFGVYIDAGLLILSGFVVAASLAMLEVLQLLRKR